MTPADGDRQPDAAQPHEARASAERLGADHEPPADAEVRRHSLAALDEDTDEHGVADEPDIEEHGAALLRDRRRIAGLVAAVVLLVIAIYVVLPKVVGLHDILDRVSDATWYWLPIAAAFNAVSFVAYTMLFQGVFGDAADAGVRRRLDTRASYQITMAGFVATILFSAAGAGGVALTYWALRKAGMRRRRVALRMVTFIVLLYSIYAFALVLFGVLLRTHVLPGDSPVGGTIVPAAICGALLAMAGLVSLIPADLERRIARLGSGQTRWSRAMRRVASVPATVASGVRMAIDYLRHPKRSARALLGAVGWWAGNIGVLWASFRAFGVAVPFGVVVQGYFLGMVANLAPSPAAGVGTVDAGIIGAFVLFGIPASAVFPAVLTFRFVGFWLPIPVGVWAYVQLRRTVRRWEAEGPPPATIKSKVTAEAT